MDEESTKSYNAYFSVNKRSHIVRYKASTNSPFFVSIYDDIMLPLAILIPTTYSLKMFNTLRIVIDNLTIWDIPISLLCDLMSTKVENGYYEILIRKDIFSSDPDFEGIPLLLITRNIYFILDAGISVQYKLYTKNTCLNGKLKNSYVKNTCCFRINQYFNEKFENTSSISIRKTGYHKGFFVNTNKKIEGFDVNIGNQMLFGYDGFEQKIACNIIKEYEWTNKHRTALCDALSHIIPMEIIDLICEYTENKYLLWVPYEPCLKWYEVEDCIYCNSRIVINFNKKYSGKIYSVLKNLLVVQSGSILLYES